MSTRLRLGSVDASPLDVPFVSTRDLRAGRLRHSVRQGDAVPGAGPAWFRDVVRGWVHGVNHWRTVEPGCY